MDVYRRKAVATRQRRRNSTAAGTKAQQAAVKRYISVGADGLTAEEAQLLESHPIIGRLFRK